MMFENREERKSKEKSIPTIALHGWMSHPPMPPSFIIYMSATEVGDGLRTKHASIKTQHQICPEAWTTEKTLITVGQDCNPKLDWTPLQKF